MNNALDQFAEYGNNNPDWGSSECWRLLANALYQAKLRIDSLETEVCTLQNQLAAAKQAGQ